jgi:membrane-anchored protein YejM (alkaline phosphatase superfamily)
MAILFYCMVGAVIMAVLIVLLSILFPKYMQWLVGRMEQERHQADLLLLVTLTFAFSTMVYHLIYITAWL